MSIAVKLYQHLLEATMYVMLGSFSFIVECSVLFFFLVELAPIQPFVCNRNSNN